MHILKMNCRTFSASGVAFNLLHKNKKIKDKNLMRESYLFQRQIFSASKTPIIMPADYYLLLEGIKTCTGYFRRMNDNETELLESWQTPSKLNEVNEIFDEDISNGLKKYYNY